MSELEPFFESCDEFERGLLRSVRSDAPPVDGAVRTLTALGLDSAKLASASAKTAATSAALGTRSITVMTVAKAVGVGTLVGAVTMAVAGQFGQVQSRSTVPAVTPRVEQTSAAKVRPLPATPAKPTAIATAVLDLPSSTIGGLKAPLGSLPTSVQHEPTNTVAILPEASVVAPLVSSSAVAAFGAVPSVRNSRSTESAISIAEQVKLVDRARSALKAGRAGETFGLVEAYVQRWPNGALSTEAVILRIEAELALHDRAAAERDARAMLASQPGSRYETRVRALFASPLSE